MRETPSYIGARAEAAVAAALVAAGLDLYLPAFGAHGRVDLVFLGAAGFRGVQCKAARVFGDVLSFRTCSNTANLPRTYGPEVDFFGVCAHQLGQVFLVPVAGLPSRLCSLRLGRTRNGQSRGVRWARDYLVEPATWDTATGGAGALDQRVAAVGSSSHSTRGASDHRRSRS